MGQAEHMIYFALNHMKTLAKVEERNIPSSFVKGSAILHAIAKYNQEEFGKEGFKGFTFEDFVNLLTGSVPQSGQCLRDFKALAAGY